MPLLYFMHENISNRPDPKSTGRPRIYPLREILNAFPTFIRAVQLRMLDDAQGG